MIKLFTLFSGSGGNATLITTNSTNILIDAGVSCAKITTALRKIDMHPSEIDGILITHEHTDHINGAGVMSTRYNIPLYSAEKTLQKAVERVGNVYEHNLRAVMPGESFAIRDCEIHPFAIPHDAAEPMGYSVCDGTKRVTVATDLGHISQSLLKNLCKSDIVLIESNHDTNMLKNGKYPHFLKKRILGDYGHLSNERAAWLAAQLAIWGTTKIVLGHLSRENNTPEAAYGAAFSMLEDNNIKIGRDVLLKVAPMCDVMEV